MTIQNKRSFSNLTGFGSGRELRLTQLAVAVASTLLHLSAQAEQPIDDGTSGFTPKGPVQEVVITAEKRGSTVRKTPLSISAVSGDDLVERGVTGVSELARETPGIAAQSSGPGQSEYSIRGMSSSAGVAATVGFYLDEFPVSPPTTATGGKTAIDPDLYDLARVEILRVPQGTLYGASSMGGTIKLVPTEPKLNKSEGSVQVKGSMTAGGGPNGTANAMVNLPIAENTAALRIVATKKHNSGWIDRTVVSDFPLPVPDESGDFYTAARGNLAGKAPVKRYTDVNSENTESVRASLLFKPSRRLTIVPSVLYQNIRQNGPDVIDATPGDNVHYQPFDVAEPFLDRFSMATLKVTYDMDNWTLVSATSYSRRTRRQVQDSTELLLKAEASVFGATTYSGGGTGFGSAAMTETNPLRQVTQEIRLSSNSSGPLKWITGLFYSKLQSAYEAKLLAPQATDFVGTTNIYTASLADNLKQSALFGNVSYEILPNLRATAGLRYFSSRDTATNQDTGLFSSGVGETTSTKSEGYNPTFNLAYTLDANTLLYASASKGFRDGAAQHGVPSSCEADLTALGLHDSPERYAPDTVWSYEAGTKSRLLNGKLDINASVYHMKWNNMQQVVVLPTCGFTYTDNVATAKISGFEIEAKARLARNLELDQGIGYTHARISSANERSPSKIGDKLLGVPAFTANTSIRHSLELDDDHTLVTRLNASYIGPQDALTAQRVTLPGYTLWGLRSGVQADNWSLSLYVDNLTNKKAVFAIPQSLTINTPDLNRAATSRPRTIGLDYTRSF